LGQKEDTRLAESVSGIDVIIGGHSHDRICPPLVVNGTLIAQAGEYGELLGRLDLKIDPVSGKVVDHAAQLIPINEGIAEDTELMRKITREKDRVQELMSRAVGELLEPLELFHDRECSAGNLLADALLERYPGFQVAFVIGEHWNTGLDVGVVTRRDLYSANRSTGNPARIEITGAQLKQFICEAVKLENINNRLHALRGRPVGMPHVAGMKVVIDQDQPGKVEIWINDRLVEEDEKIRAVTSDIEISDILNYLFIPDEEVKYEVPTIISEVMENYLRRHSPIGHVDTGRIVFTGSIGKQ
jgi:2',3'-cyclic-nucleotide 2'-phosphodiesterase (5'-nucleotidase family)